MEAAAVVENPCRFITLPYCTRNHSSPCLLCKFATSKTDAFISINSFNSVFTDAEIEEHFVLSINRASNTSSLMVMVQVIDKHWAD